MFMLIYNLLTATAPVFLKLSSTERGDQVVFDTGVTGLGDKIGATVFWTFSVCTIEAGCTTVLVAVDGARLTRSNFHSGASDTSVVTSLEKKSSMLWNIQKCANHYIINIVTKHRICRTLLQLYLFYTLASYTTDNVKILIYVLHYLKNIWICRRKTIASLKYQPGPFSFCLTMLPCIAWD